MVAYVFAWLFVFAVPWEDVVVLPGVGTLSKVLGIAAFGATALRVLLRGRMRKLVSFHWIAFAYLCWVILSASWAVNIYCGSAFGCDVRNVINIYLQIFVMLWVVWEATPTPSRLIGLLQAYVLGAYVAAGSTIYNFAIGAVLKRAYGRFAANGFDPNELGMLLALALPMAWYIGSKSANPLQRWVNRGYFVAGSMAILLTGSRGALLATIAALSVVPWTMTQVRRGVRITAIVIMIGAGVLAVRFVPEELFKRLSTTTTEISQGTMNERLEIWKAGIAAVPVHPLKGYGPAGWRTALSKRLGIKGAHNTYLAILVEEGAVGLFLFLSMFALVFKRLLALPPPFERRVTLAILGTLIIALIPLDWDTKKASWLVIGLLMSSSDVFAAAYRVAEPDAAMRVSRYGPASRRSLRGAPPATLK